MKQVGKTIQLPFIWAGLTFILV